MKQLQPLISCLDPLARHRQHSVRKVLHMQHMQNAPVNKYSMPLRHLPNLLLCCCLQLPEYYLTAAEADILAASATDIVQACVAQQGPLLVELGAG